MKNQSLPKTLLLVFVAMAGLLFGSDRALAQATITIVNTNAPGVGFNDPTPAAPVGGNPGTTLGQQRLIAFQYAASVWGSKLKSNVEIKIQASFQPLSCTATGAVLGSAGAIQVFGNFPNAPLQNTWYHVALANKLAGVDLAPGPGGTSADDIIALFNSNLGNPGCLTGIPFYLGLDGNHGSKIDLVTVLLHEFAHGLGFSTFVNKSTGAFLAGFPDTYSKNLIDTSTSKTFDQMTNAERASAILKTGKLAWTGTLVTAAVPKVLTPGMHMLRALSPSPVAGIYYVGEATFGPALSSPGVTGQLVLAFDPADAGGPSTTDGCSPLTNAAAIAGNIALIDRGTCGFVVKVKNAQDAGAIGVVIADNAAGSPPAGMSGVDPTITIPSVRVSLPDANTLKANIAGGVSVRIGIDLSVLQGTDDSGKALLYAPVPLVSGSSTSHWDTVAFRNQLMEPNINGDLTHSVNPPEDMTLPLLGDVGWYKDSDLDGIPDDEDCEPNSDLRPTVIIGDCNTDVPNTLSPDGCTLADQINHLAAANPRNRGAFVSAVAHLTEQLVAGGAITSAQKDAIMSCAARLKLN